MKPAAGISLELLGLAASLSLAPLIPAGIVFALYLVAVEFLATYLVHCPAHYLTGLSLGIRFRRIRIGRTTLARGLPPSLGSLAGALSVPTLVVDRKSLAAVSRLRAASMYASGTIASVGSAILIAAAATPSVPSPYIIPAWAFAVGYFAFDLVFSPRTGDLKRARAALAGRRAPQEPVQAEER
jgi:hypothetical protein